MTKLKCEIELELKDNDGKVLEKRRFPSHTYVLHFFIAIASHFASRSMTVTKIDGTATTTSPTSTYAYYDLGANGGYGETTKGIVIGTSDTPYSPTNNSLQSIINHGSGVGQMFYGVQVIDAPQQITGGYRFVLSRVFTNASGSSITVKEIGIYVYMCSSIYIMMTRDVIVPVTVGNGQSLTVRYIISLTYS